MRTLVITHKDCFDGHTAAWIYSRFVDRDAEFTACRYGDPAPDVKGRNVVIADFSFPRGEMFRLACDAESLVVLDHHKTAQEALLGLERQVLNETGKPITVVFDMERSGAGLTWDFYMGPPRTADPMKLSRPILIAQVEARDLWRTNSFDGRYMANVYAAEMTFEAWDKLYDTSYEELLSRGEAILDYMHQYGTKGLAEAFQRNVGRMGIAGRNSEGNFFLERPAETYARDVWTVNMPYMNCSDYLSRLMAEKNVDFVMGYFCRNDGRWQFSLRSRNGFDCSVIAKAFGGGGHKEAAGFDVASLTEVFLS